MKLCDHKDRRAVLAFAGEAMFGRRWRAPMARRLSVASRTVLRWAQGSFEVNDSVWQMMPDLLREAADGKVLEAKALTDLASRIQGGKAA
jgi:hypothetical protein